MSGTYQLSDKYTADHGTVFLTGIQAMARLPIEQLRADRRNGLDTAAFVSGYPGSPLGGYDGAVVAAARLAPDLPIVHRPAVNEEYAATAVMGSQLASVQSDFRYDGVLGIWYGKAPGVDRASDALRHGVFAGASAHGGALALVGDDPTAKSSTIPSSSAGVLADLHMPLLYPGDPAEVLDLGRHGVAMSRVTGLWVAMKIVADVADGTESVELHPERVEPVIPQLDGHPYTPRPEGRLLTPLSLDLEREIYEVRYELAIHYAADNQLNPVTVDPTDAWLGIVSSGITYREVREALARLGLSSDADIAASGIRLLKMQMPIPFDPRTVQQFARGLTEVFVIEEKQPNIESLVKDALYAVTDRPVVVGKRDENGVALVPGYGGLDADTLLPTVRRRLVDRLGDRLAPEPPARRPSIALTVDRAPFYCSGCPHNRSTEAPDGALVGAGIGCHTMAMLMDPNRFGEITGVTCMGSEGAQWIGMAPFIERDHLIQNLGDGTYFHSGQLAITAAVAAGVNITYKLLYNDAVAMTGGQTPPGQLGVPDVASVLLHKGVRQVLITTDDRRKYRGVTLPDGVDVWDRERLMEAQELLATVPGVTVLIHDQACAAELRRARKRKKVVTPSVRVVINERLCEGCGDCGQVSNCLSVQPVDTPFGRKTRIDQTTCNLDYSCLEGDCPSFMTIETEPSLLARLLPAPRLSRSGAAAPVDLEALTATDDLPDPQLRVPADDYAMRITGVGGTGVVTVAQIIGTAAMFAGYEVRGLDQIGLSQKAGPVVSDLRLTKDGRGFTNRLGLGQADLLLAFDLLGAASDRGLHTGTGGRTVVVGSSTTTPTGAMIAHPELEMPAAEELHDRIRAVTDPDAQLWADADAITTAAFGESVTANVFVTGMAVQAGALPIDAGLMEDAITLNGVAVEENLAAFRLGRRYAHAPAAVEALVAGPSDRRQVTDTDLRRRIDALGLSATDTLAVDRRVADLVAYQSRRYAERYLRDVERTAASERRVDESSRRLTLAVAENLHKLLAYKDEYEVARLMLDAAANAEAEHIAGADGRVSYRLHPPILRAMGVDRKIGFGAWSRPLFSLLAKGKRLRGTPLDPFGPFEVRQVERALPKTYRAALDVLLDGLTAATLDQAVAIASLPDMVRGYEHLKLQRAAMFRDRLDRELARYRATT